MKRVFIVLGIIFAAIIVLGVGCTALVVNEADKAIKAEEKNDRPTEVAVGKEFTHDDYVVNAGWKVRRDGTTGWLEVTGKVTNGKDEPGTPMLTFTFLKGDEVLMTADCLVDELEPGQTGRLNCPSTEKFTKDYDTVTIKDLL